MKRLLIVLMLLASPLFAKDWAQPIRPECGGWENWMTVVVTQDPSGSCIKARLEDNCYTVSIVIHPGPDTCQWQFSVRQQTVDNVIKDFMAAYLQ